MNDWLQEDDFSCGIVYSCNRTVFFSWFTRIYCSIIYDNIYIYIILHQHTCANTYSSPLVFDVGCDGAARARCERASQELPNISSAECIAFPVCVSDVLRSGGARGRGESVGWSSGDDCL